MSSEPLIRDITDTARWVALHRARESERADAVFSDPFARRLAGARGERIAAAMPMSDDVHWSVTARTWALDRIVARGVASGVDTILNLAAGLDARPYRLELPASMRWVEVDSPEILDYKAEVLAADTPRCRVERVPLDITNADARRGLFGRIARGASNVLVITEGLLIYLMEDEVASLARDLAAQPPFGHWATDIASPGLLKLMRESSGEIMQMAGAPFLFAPPSRVAFFEAHGWKESETQSLLKAAGQLGRLPFKLRMFSLLPERKPAGDIPWSGVTVLERA